MKPSDSLHVILSLVLLVTIQGCHAPSAPTSSRANASLSDVEFAKSTFAALADGDATAASDIDWESFKASGTDVGAMYKKFSDEPNREGFRSSFVKNYSETFKKSGADVNSLKNWKLDKQDAGTATISAEAVSHKHLQLTLTKKGGVRRLSGIDILP